MKAYDIMRMRKGAPAPPFTLSPLGSMSVTTSVKSATTAAQTFSIANGTGPYTWDTTINTTDGITVSFGTTSGPKFSKGGMLSGHSYTGTATTVVTDTGAGNATASCAYPVDFECTP